MPALAQEGPSAETVRMLHKHHVSVLERFFAACAVLDLNDILLNVGFRVCGRVGVTLPIPKWADRRRRVVPGPVL